MVCAFANASAVPGATLETLTELDLSEVSMSCGLVPHTLCLNSVALTNNDRDPRMQANICENNNDSPNKNEYAGWIGFIGLPMFLLGSQLEKKTRRCQRLSTSLPPPTST